MTKTEMMTIRSGADVFKIGEHVPLRDGRFGTVVQRARGADYFSYLVELVPENTPRPSRAQQVAERLNRLFRRR